MDWSSVTAEDLVDALREVDWSTPPRPVSEFFSRFTAPRSYSKWTSRLKCNLYYYRTNYFILIMFILGMGFLRKPVSIFAAFSTGLSIAFLNDSFAVTFNEKVTRTVRQFSPHLATKMRPPLRPVIRGRPSSKRSIHICGRPRWVFVVLFSVVSCFLWMTSCSLLTVLWALIVGLLATLLHASFRTPNLKARLNTFREEFRAVWRNYSEELGTQFLRNRPTKQIHVLLQPRLTDALGKHTLTLLKTPAQINLSRSSS
uniref:PRA1 family protein n=1 Tax=Oryza glumipatula TaxID=40148 RepID=A0A0D9YHA7_9ORYZ